MNSRRPFKHQHFVTTTCLLFLISVTYTSFAQQDDRFRARYDRTKPAPDEVYFPYFLASVARDRTEHDLEHAILQVQQKLEYSTRDEAVDVFEFLGTLLTDLNNEQLNYMRNEICPLDKPRPTGPAVFRVLDYADDHNENLGKSYLQAVEYRLDPNSFRLFLDWMAERKLGAQVGIFNHANLYKNQNPDIVRQGICGRFDSRQPQN